MKKMITMTVLSALMLAFAPLQAEARGSGMDGWLLDFDLSYLSSKTETTTSSSTSNSQSSTTYYDVNLGYIMPSGLYVGGVYGAKNYSSSGSASVSTSTSASAMGASVGYAASNGVYINATYFLSATDQDYKKGSGLGLDLGWRSFMSSSFFVGAKLTYRSLKYTENATVSGFESTTSTVVLPYLSFGFTF